MPTAAQGQQQLEELCAATIRALRDDPRLHLRGGVPHEGHRPLPLRAPHLYPVADEDDFASFRGAADGIALRLGLSDLDTHRRFCPTEPLERLVFEMLEQFRVESLVPGRLPGAAANLRHRHRAWSLALHRARLTESTSGLLVYTVAQICRSRVTGDPVVPETEDLLEPARVVIGPVIGPALRALRSCRDDQRAYAAHALEIARSVGGLARTAEVDGTDAPDDPGRASRFGLHVDIGEYDDATPATSPSRTGSRVERHEGGYRVFTDSYDREVRASDLVRPAQLQEYRASLDGRVAHLGVSIARFARELRMMLAHPVPDGWESTDEPGYVDGRRLARLVTSPTERRLFRTEHTEPVADCMVTLLVDCSGSMKRYAEATALLVDVLGRALDMAGVTTEVLGFTTGAWNGGRALRDWRRAGRPSEPGRLNELHHIVFKGADSTWRSARRQVAGLLKADLYREGVDGEAILWACRRMNGRPERRRILVVISDGSPMDSATALANGPDYLDRHLRDVLLPRELSGDVEIHGLGVGLDLGPFYRHHHAVDLAHGPTGEVFREILRLLRPRRLPR